MNGITKGLQLMADFLKLFIKAIRSGKGEAISDCISVAEQWLGETVDTVGKVRISPWALIAGADPWKDSRTKYRLVAEKWEGHL